MSIEFYCPSCARRLTADESVAGKKGKCHYCRAIVSIPASLAPAVELSLAPQGAAPVSASIEAEAIPGLPRELAPMPPMVPPPLPVTETPRPSPARARPSIPLPVSSAIKAGTDSMLDRAMNSLTRSLSLSKLGLFLAGAITIAVFAGLVLWAAGAVAFSVGGTGGAIMFAIAVLAVFLSAIGLIGVLSGGVAHLAHRDSEGRPGGIAAGISFCGRRFLSLFGGSVSTALAVGLGLLMVNGFILLLNLNPTVGSFIAALLFLPQLAANLILILILAVSVLVPCAIAVEGIGAGKAMQRLIACIRNHGGQLMVQLALTLFFGGAVVSVLALLVGTSLAPTLASNGPTSVLHDLAGLLPGDLFSSAPGKSASLFESEPSSAFGGNSRNPYSPGSGVEPRSSRLSEQPSGDGLRTFCVALVYLLVLVFPAVYWIVSFTSYYESAQTPGRHP